MLQYSVTRLFRALPLVWAICTLVFGVVHLLPGDPIELVAGEQASLEQKQAVARALRLDLPIFLNEQPLQVETQGIQALWHAVRHTQYAWFLHDLLTGQLQSLHSRREVASILAEKLPYTLALGSAAMLLALLLALPLGTLAARKPGGALDQTVLTLSLVGVSLPSFWLGPLGMLIFGVWLGWLPISGAGSGWHLILPACTLGLGLTGLLLRMTRSVVLETLQEDFIRTARSKGVSELRILFAHALRAAAGPIVVVAGLQLGALLTGSILTEEIFGWPGLGRELILAVRTRDYPLLQGCVLLISVTWIGVNLGSELIQAALHPSARVLIDVEAE